MKIVVGLGNYGEEFKRTRHNAGFMALDRLAVKYAFSPFKFEKKFEAEIAEGRIKNEKTLLVKPQTYMNASGRAIKKLLDFYKLSPQDVLVLHDELDLPLGKFKLVSGRGSAGHKGIISLIEHLGTKEFTRLRIGIESLQPRLMPTEKFVLENFDGEELEVLESLWAKILELVEAVF